MKLIMKNPEGNKLWGDIDEQGHLKSLASDNPQAIQNSLWKDLTDKQIGSTAQVLLTHALIYGIKKI